VSQNVLRETLSVMRLRFLQKVWIAFLSIGAYVTLWYVDWRIALAIFALECARNTAAVMGRGGQ
jgi:hypothetical protein